MLGTRSGKAHIKRPRPELTAGALPPAPTPSGNWEERGWQTPTETEKALKPMRSGLFPQRSREPHRSEPRPPHPLRALPSPPWAGSAWPRGLTRALYPPDGEKSRKLATGSPPSLASSLPLASSHLPAPHEEQDASSR